jgi:hypothetical protein
VWLLRKEAKVGYAELLQGLFPDLHPEVADLYLLESHQIADLPERAPGRELAAVLHAHPHLRRFLVIRHPPIEEFVTRLLAEHEAVDAGELALCEDNLVWELADWIAYQRDPDGYDAGTESFGDLAAITNIEPLDNKTVIDAGAGTGRVSFAVAPLARHVYALEPVAALRQFIRAKANRLGIENVFVLDGFLHAIPLPDGSVDMLVTRQAIGWKLDEELLEIGRVVKPGGMALHLFSVPYPAPSDDSLHLALASHGYAAGSYQEGTSLNRTYWKRIEVYGEDPPGGI